MLLEKDTIYQTLKVYIQKKCGLYFKDFDLKNLKKSINKRMSILNIDNTEEYYNYLLNSSQKENEFRDLLNLLTIRYTYFFRNEPHFKALKDKILPEIIENKKNSKSCKPLIKIWSAGCSTGQEAYSIAMTINDIIDNPEQWDIQILATDVSTNAIQSVKVGEYEQNAMKLVDEFHKKKYFKEKRLGEKKIYEIKDSIKKLIMPYYLNLAERNYPQDIDILFCRNVMIYFDVDTIKEIVEKFSDSLNDNGYLFIGYSESIKYISDKFRMNEYKEAIFYRKTSEQNRLIQSSKSKYELLTNEFDFNQNYAVSDYEVTKETQEISDDLNIIEIINNINRYIQLKEYEKALVLIEYAQKIDANLVTPYYLSAQVNISIGKNEEAKRQLKRVLSIDGLYVPAYYLMGIISMEDDLEKAKGELKKAIYLDKNFALAHLALATVYQNCDQIMNAVREYRNTIKILSSVPPDSIVEHSGGFNVGTLKSICKNSLEGIKEGV